MDIHSKNRQADISPGESEKSSLSVVSSEPSRFNDPVCGMSVEPTTARGGSATHGGKTYYFCAPSCREKFQADPQRYLGKDGSGSESQVAAGAKRQVLEPLTTRHSPGTSLYTCPMHPEVQQ